MEALNYSMGEESVHRTLGASRRLVHEDGYTQPNQKASKRMRLDFKLRCTGSAVNTVRVRNSAKKCEGEKQAGWQLETPSG